MKGLNTEISVTYTFNICPISDVHTGSKRGESERGEFERGESERDMIGSREDSHSGQINPIRHTQYFNV